MLRVPLGIVLGVGAGGIGFGYSPVSYTHLDVYKRQMLQRSDISKKFTAGSREWPSAAIYFVGSIMENSEPLPGSETTLI